MEPLVNWIVHKHCYSLDIYKCTVTVDIYVYSLYNIVATKKVHNRNYLSLWPIYGDHKRDELFQRVEVLITTLRLMY